MPGMDGLQLLAEIKQRFPDLPVMRNAAALPPSMALLSSVRPINQEGEARC